MTLNENTLKKKVRKQVNRAISHIGEHGVTDVELMPNLFEISVLNKFGRDKWQDLTEQITTNICNALTPGKDKQVQIEQLELHPLQHVLIPKKTIADFRKCSLADIKDEITYLSIVLLLATHIEKERIPKSKERVFSYRFNGSVDENQLFFEEFSHTAFGKKIAEKSRRKTTKVRVECDIASFYDRLNLHRLNSILLNIDGINSDAVHLLDQLLLFWQDRNSYGLPVGSNGSRILAESALIEVDRQLLKSGVDFIRFVDDYRIFANNAAIANQHLALLVRTLEREGLFLNSSKTKIVDVSDIENIKTRESQEKPDSMDDPNSLSHKGEPTSQPTENSQNTAPVSRYAGLIPLKFRKPSDTESERLKLLDIRNEIRDAKKSIVLDEKKFRQICSAMASQNNFSHSASLVALTLKCPQFTPYTVSFLIKYSSSIPKADIHKIVTYYDQQLQSKSTPEFIRLAIAQLFASNEFENRSKLFGAYLNLERGYGGILGRAYLSAMTGGLTRSQILNIKENARNMTLFECRGIAHLVIEGLHPSEGEPFLKNLALQYNDYFLRKLKSSKS